MPDYRRGEQPLDTVGVAGAGDVEALTALMASAGFTDILTAPKDASREFIGHWVPGRSIENYIASASMEAVKPMENPT